MQINMWQRRNIFSVGRQVIYTTTMIVMKESVIFQQEEVGHNNDFWDLVLMLFEK